MPYFTALRMRLPEWDCDLSQNFVTFLGDTWSLPTTANSRKKKSYKGNA